VTITATGGWKGLRQRTFTAIASIRGGRWRTRLRIPGRDREPGDRWTLKATYAGDGAHGGAATSRQIITEAEGTGGPGHERG
jgi:hypothetical protein